MTEGDYPAGTGQPVPPMNAPQAVQLGYGVQPGTPNIIRAFLVIISGAAGSGLFVYSPVPGPGNLVASIAASAGTDPFGNSYRAGIFSYQGAEAVGFSSVFAPSASPAVQWYTGDPSEIGPSGIFSEVISNALATIWEGPQVSGFPEDVDISLISASSIGTFSAQGQMRWALSTSNPAQIIASWGGVGFGAICDSDSAGLGTGGLVGKQPGTTNPPIAETSWHQLGPFSNGWTKGANIARYRILPDGMVLVQFQNIGVGTNANGTNILTSANGLPPGYRPSTGDWYPVRCDASGAQTTSVFIGTDGHFECWGFAGTATRMDAGSILVPPFP